MISKFKQTITKKKTLLNPGNSKSNPLFFPHKFHMDVDKCFISFQVVLATPWETLLTPKSWQCFVIQKPVGKSNNKGHLK